MKESQQVEWKEAWRDEYLKWVCGFANAQGGVLEIGRGRDGKPVGIRDAAKLMEQLPNKMRDMLGIIADVDLFEEDGHELLRIKVEPYPYPVSYKGEYHYRSGSTKQVLKGAALDRFLLGKTGKRWDSVPLPGVSIGDLDAAALKRFRQLARGSRRLSDADLDIEDPGLIQKLRLTEGEYLKRSAVLLFHPDPEQFISGASVKIGFFEGAEVLFQDEVRGDLFSQLDRTMDLLLTKYMRANIHYEGIQRIEQLPIPEDALRETVVNAIVHKDYSSAVPIQIRVYDDRLTVWNNGQLSEGWTVQYLNGRHASQPRNPDIANTFFLAGMIETWGRGIEEVTRACEAAGLAAPELRHEAIGLMVKYRFRDESAGNDPGNVGHGCKQRPNRDQAGTRLPLSGHQTGTRSELGRHQVEVLKMCREDRALSDLMGAAGRSDRTKFRRQALTPLLEAGLLEMTIPDKPSSSRQKYRTTPAAAAIVKDLTSRGESAGGDPGSVGQEDKPGPGQHLIGTRSAPSRD